MSGAVRAEVAAADPIDASMRTCLARSDMSSTAGQVQCMETARAAWQSASDHAYQQLLAKAPASRRLGWERSQRSWKAWREAEAPMLKAVFETTQGTMYVLFAADMQLQPVRDRALALRSAAANTGNAGDAGNKPVARLRACSQDADCAHADRDMNRYYQRLRKEMPSRARPTLARAQRAWLGFRDATTPLGDARGRIDVIGARVATLKRLSETVGND
ncbi:lysozyme inhibitor LprI family protein [Paraburkholderia saeva]|nr:lysozyme inhibitor LprI family protein [Paraburkholderia saeva]